jgi:hypothetical protein
MTMKLLLQISLAALAAFYLGSKVMFSDLDHGVDARYHYKNIWESDYKKSFFIFIGVAAYVTLTGVAILEIMFSIF